MSSPSHTNNDGDDGQPIEKDATTTSSTTETVVSTTCRNATSSPEAITAAFEFANLVGQLKMTPRTGWLRRNIVPCESVADHSWRVAILAFLLLSPSAPNPRPDNSFDNSNSNSNNNNNNVCNDFDIGKVIQMALIHDVAECIVGDITPEDNVSKDDKHQLEYNAMRQITQLLHTATSSNTKQNCDDDSNSSSSSKAESAISKLEDNLLMKLFHEYEERHSLESIIVKDLDLLDMILQANTYELQYSLVNHQESIDLSDFFTGTPPSRFQIPEIRQIAEYIHQQRNDRIYHHMIHNNDNNTKISQPTENELENNNGDHITQSNRDSVHVAPSSSNDDINMISLSKSDLAFIEEYSPTIQHPSQQQTRNAAVTTTTTTTTSNIRDLVAATVLALRQWDHMNHKSGEEEP
jgi:putative hydrolases of HD superfamily